MIQGISKFIYTKILGWKLVGHFPKEIKKYVIIGAPHTSWHDFYIGMLVKYAFSAKINFIAKKSLFAPPFGWFFRMFGGIPVDRGKNNNLVDAIILLFKKKEEFRLGLSPEGTRKRVAKWKTGFYYIAKGAKVPIVMFTLDFGNKQIRVSKPYYTTDNIEKDFMFFLNFYKDVKGATPKFFNNERIF